MTAETSHALVVIDPVQGEQLDILTASTGRLGHLLADIRDHETQLRYLKELVSAELHARWDRERCWTEHVDGLTLTGRSDSPIVEWDVQGLMTELDTMVTEGILTPSARDKAIQVRIDYKVAANGINALMKSRAFAERLAPYRRELPAEGRRVTVTRTG